MRLFQHLTPSQISRHFVYRGLMFGLVPVYVGDLSRGMPDISVRNGIPELMLDMAEGLYAGFSYLAELLGHDVEGFPIRITGRLDGAPLEDL
jgi:hypothetical protein